MPENNLDTTSSAADKVKTEKEREKRLDREESAMKLKAIIFVVIPMLIGFLTFTYFFLNSIEEKSRLLKEQTNQNKNISTPNSSEK
jgi:cytoskeletal protein RodZ